jgi:quercetin dioxygenase-like cupin family protein
MAALTITLNEFEMNVLKDVCSKRKAPFDPKKTTYTPDELSDLGVIREYYSIEEVRDRGFSVDGVVTSFDAVAERAKTELRVGAPFAKKVTKWQLPIDVPGFRTIVTSFPPGTVVMPHVHNVLDAEVKSGGLRVVTKGSIEFQGRKYLPGDWFFIPNGVPYSFTTDPDMETEENYWYGHNVREIASRISNPSAT